MITLTSEELNLIIRGKQTFRKCPCCDNEGVEIQAYDSCGEPCRNDNPEAWHDNCENCDGVGFLWNTLEE